MTDELNKQVADLDAQLQTIAKREWAKLELERSKGATEAKIRLVVYIWDGIFQGVYTDNPELAGRLELSVREYDSNTLSEDGLKAAVDQWEVEIREPEYLDLMLDATSDFD